MGYGLFRPMSQESSIATDRKNLLLPNTERWPLDGKPIIELVDVSIGFDGHQILSGLNLKIETGKTTVVVGRSGSGKSVLLKLMMGLLKPDTGKVFLFGNDVSETSPVDLIELRKRMSMLFQNYALFDSLAVDENIGFPLIENSKLKRGTILEMAEELLDVLGLKGTNSRLPAELSGGMRKRVSLARSLIANPEVVLFDEPTTGLDPIMIEKVDEMIALAAQKYQITSAIISHDMASTKRLADQVAFLHEGKIVFFGTYDGFMNSDLPPVKSFVEGASTNRLSRGSASAADVEVEKPAPREEDPVVELVGLHKRFGDNHVLRGVDLKIYPGEITVLIGGSGSGKSVIVKHIMGLMKATAGEVRVFGEDVTPMGNDEIEAVRRRFGMVFQHAALLDWLTIFENVAFPVQERTSLSRSEIKERVEDVLERLFLTEIMHRLPGEVSAGQAKRAAVARALVMRPEIMIYDEPTTGQDPIRTRQVDDMIQQAQERFDIASIVISHDMSSTFRIAHQIALLNRGQIAAHGTPRQIRSSDNEYVEKFIYAGEVAN